MTMRLSSEQASPKGDRNISNSPVVHCWGLYLVGEGGLWGCHILLLFLYLVSKKQWENWKTKKNIPWVPLALCSLIPLIAGHWWSSSPGGGSEVSCCCCVHHCPSRWGEERGCSQALLLSHLCHHCPWLKKRFLKRAERAWGNCPCPLPHSLVMDWVTLGIFSLLIPTPVKTLTHSWGWGVSAGTGTGTQGLGGYAYPCR